MYFFGVFYDMDDKLFQVKLLCVNSKNIQNVRYKYKIKNSNFINGIKYSIYLGFISACLIGIAYFSINLLR